MSEPSLKLLLLSAALALLAVSLASALLPPSEDYKPSNPYWNGLELFSKVVNATPVDLARDVVSPEGSVLFVVGPSPEVAQQYVTILREYLSRGGTLVLMDETGAANSILSGLGLGVSIDGHPMLDPVFYYRSWRMPKAINVVVDDLTSGVKEIVLDIPSILNVESSSVKVLAYSSSFSFLDLNADSEPSAEEPRGPFAVAAVATYGRGRVILFSDSSVFLNGVIGLGDNLKLLKNLAKGKRVYVDVEVWPASTPREAYRSAVLAFYNALSAPEPRYCLALATATVIYALTRKEKAVPRDEEVEEVLKRHPDWDRHLLEALKGARRSVKRG
jgi:hypothetical protein